MNANEKRIIAKAAKSRKDRMPQEDKVAWVLIRISNELGNYPNALVPLASIREAQKQLNALARTVPAQMRPVLRAWLRDLNTLVGETDARAANRTVAHLRDSMGRVSRPLRQAGKWPWEINRR